MRFAIQIAMVSHEKIRLCNPHAFAVSVDKARGVTERRYIKCDDHTYMIEKLEDLGGKVEHIARLVSKNHTVSTVKFGGAARSTVFKAIQLHHKIKAAESAPAPEKEDLQVGDIVYTSWGYDQTNVHFYQVVKRTPKMVHLREVEKMRCVKKLSDMLGHAVARKDVFSTEKVTKHRIQYRGIRVSIKMNYSYASKWDGKPKHYTSYA